MTGFKAETGLFFQTSEIQTAMKDITSFSRATIQQDMIRFQRASTMYGGFKSAPHLSTEAISKMIAQQMKQKGKDTPKKERQPKPPAKEKGKKTKAKPNDPPKSSDNTPNLKFKSWQTHYGDTAPDKEQYCFFFWNKIQKCSKKSKCDKLHGNKEPDGYDGKNFNDLSTAKQLEITAKCK